MKVKQGVPFSFSIDYNITTNDAKVEADIAEAKFFLATAPGEADDKYLLKSYGSGLIYSDGQWEINIGQEDFDFPRSSNVPFRAVLAIKYVGDTKYREPDLIEDGEPLIIYIDAAYSE